eukprot:scaffold72200_cov31-Tisochrysis_lutea.AAC.2
MRPRKRCNDYTLHTDNNGGRLQLGRTNVAQDTAGSGPTGYANTHGDNWRTLVRSLKMQGDRGSWGRWRAYVGLGVGLLTPSDSRPLEGMRMTDGPSLRLTRDSKAQSKASGQLRSPGEGHTLS